MIEYKGVGVIKNEFESELCHLLCDLGQIMLSFWASVASSM